MTARARPWTSKVPIKLKGIFRGKNCPSKRTLDIIDLAYGAYKFYREEAGLPVEAKPKWFCEVGQSAERSPWSATVPAASTKAKVYYYATDQILAARQLAWLHGYPIESELLDMPEAKHKKITGNSVFLPHMAMAIIAAFLNEHGSWHNKTWSDRMPEPGTPSTPSSVSSSVGSPASVPSSTKRRKLAEPL